MNVGECNQVFHRALKLYRQGELQASAKDFRMLLQKGSRDPRHISYCGLLVATAEGNVTDGAVLCELAVREASANPEMYINLARVYAWNGQASRAADVLRKGLQVAPNDPGLQREIKQVSPRSKPKVFFLNRDNPVNKYLGRSKSRFWRKRRRRRSYRSFS